MIFLSIVAGVSIAALLWKLLFCILVIACIGAVIWCINSYISPIPPPILAVLAIVLVILAAIYLLGGQL